LLLLIFNFPILDLSLNHPLLLPFGSSHLLLHESFFSIYLLFLWSHSLFSFYFYLNPPPFPPGLSFLLLFSSSYLSPPHSSSPLSSPLLIRVVSILFLTKLFLPLLSFYSLRYERGEEEEERRETKMRKRRRETDGRKRTRTAKEEE
jgi:hypothetical protein